MKSPGINVVCASGLLLLAACSSAPEKIREQAPQNESQTLNRSANLAYQQGHFAQASTLYSAALDQALSEDNAEAITDARFNLALTLTALGKYPDALDQITQAEGERERRGLAADPQLRLLAAAVYYRQDEFVTAANLLQPLLGATSDVRSRAVFILGLIDARKENAAALQERIVSLPHNPIDRLELEANLAAIQGDDERALVLFDEVIAERGLEHDFRGMSRAMATAGNLAERIGRERLAADYLLRAGRSAAQRQGVEARAWLQRALQLGESTGDRALVLEAEAALATLARENR